MTSDINSSSNSSAFNFANFFGSASTSNVSTTTTATASSNNDNRTTNSSNPHQQIQQRRQLADTYGSSLIPYSGQHVTYDIGWYRKEGSSNNSTSMKRDDEGDDAEEKAAVRIRQPATTPIAHVNNKTSPTAASGVHNNGKLVDCNHRFIVYAVKNGLLRVIDKQTGERSLIRGHSGKDQFVTDVSFFHPSSDILATVGPFSFGTLSTSSSTTNTNITPSGGVFIWRLFLDDANNTSTNTSTISEECLLQILLPNVTRIVWHPTNTNIFVLLHGNQASVIETTKLRTTTINSRTGAICTLQHHSKNPGQTLLLEEENPSGSTTTTPITDASWSTTTAHHIYTSYHDGSLKLWDVNNTVTTNAVLATCLWSIVPDAGSPITHCTCLPPINNTNNNTTTTTLIVASQQNTKFMLYSSSSHHDEPPQLTQTVQLLTSNNTAKPSYYCVATCYPPTYTNSNNHDAFCLVADTTSPQMFVLHVATPSNISKDTYVFRQITPFQLVYPILSWSVHSTYTSTTVTHDDDDTDPSVFDIICYVVQTCAIQTLQIRSNQVSASNNTLPTNGSSRGVRVIEEEVSNKERDQPLDASSANKIERDDDLSLAESYEVEEKEEEEADEDEEDEPWNTVDGTNVNMDPFTNWLGAITTASAITSNTTTDEQLKSKHLTGNSSWKSATTTSRHLLSPVDMLSSFVGEDINNTNITTNKVDSGMPDPNRITAKSSNGPQQGRIVSTTSPSPPINTNTSMVTLNKSKGGKSPARKSKTPPVSMRQSQQQKHYSKKKGDELPPSPASAVAPMQLKILKRIPLPEHNITATATPSPSSPVPPASELDLPSFTSRTMLPSSKGAVSETKEFHDISSVIEERIGKLLSSHLHAQSQIVRDAVKEVLLKKANVEDTSILDAYKISLCQDLKDTVCESVKDPVTKAFYKTMREVMIPAYEATTQKIFEQVASAVIESKDRKTEVKLQQDMALQISTMSENLTRMMQSMASLKEEVTHLRSQVAELSSNSASSSQDGPSSLTTATVVDPLVHVKQEIKEFLAKGRYEAAFTKALSSNNAEITEYCCQKAEFSQLCARDTPVLSQLILLCVGQQLGSLLQLRKSTDLLEVVSWLQDIAVLLNPSDPTIERHVGQVIQQLMERIRSLLSAASDPSLKRPLQTLLQILRGTRAT